MLWLLMQGPPDGDLRLSSSSTRSRYLPITLIALSAVIKPQIEGRGNAYQYRTLPT